MLLRWISADPKYRFSPDTAWMEPQRANLYAFSLNNPMHWVDPDGLDTVGHHYVPESVTRKLPISDEVAEVFNKTTTGWPDGVTPHQYSSAHADYNEAVEKEFRAWAKKKGWKSDSAIKANMTAGHAKQFVEHVKSSSIPEIRDFIEPHEEVMRMKNAGKSVAEMDAYYGPFKHRWTKLGGYIRKAKRVAAAVAPVAKAGLKIAGKAVKAIEVATLAHDIYNHGLGGAMIKRAKDTINEDMWLPKMFVTKVAAPTAVHLFNQGANSSANRQATRAIYSPITNWIQSRLP
jgi:hypothetical protein